MTSEEKQLLLKDLCARLPYGVIVHVEGSIGGNYLCGDSKLVGVHNSVIYVENAPAYGNYVGLPLTIDIKPYLRSMSSMTEEELSFYNNHLITPGITILEENLSEYLDWMHSHHFDYRGLIEKGLALEAPVDMYKNE